MPRKPKQKRTKFRPSHVEILEKEFLKHPLLRPARRAELAKQLNLKESSMKIWFQNRRRKEKGNVLQKIVNSSVPAHKSTQVYSSVDYRSAKNGYTPTLTSNTQFPLCSSTYSPLISPTSETVSTQFSPCSFANAYPTNIQTIPGNSYMQYNQIAPVNSANVSSWPEMLPAYSQPPPINSTDYLYPLTNTNTAEFGVIQLTTDYPLSSPESVEGIPYTPESVEQQNENTDLYSVIEEYLESIEVQDTNLCGLDQGDTVPSSSAIKCNPSDYVTGAEMNNPLDLINMFHAN
ncbi:paired mesoderm homeobox protein 2-like [Zeugodacus cucurbitae]|uniref:paired mesoderm homeobox protein 2-like n=1 Tax=Zeugodacus cucurbitae TaxID=28588 RepID=UPI0023D9238A|nr:paired mesoderm homeobox protein 2-like [Zeugodacus cucurbitae]